MVGRYVVLTSCVLLATFFAGCTAEEAPGVKGLQGIDGEPAFDAGTGAISGIVLSEEELPIPEAALQLLGKDDEILASTSASPEGLFTLTFVPPGTHVLVAQAPRFVTATKSVEVREGQVLSDVVFKLTAGASDVPYHTITVFPIVISGYAVAVKSPMPISGVTQEGDTGGCMYAPPPADPSSAKSCQGTRQSCEPEENACEIHYGHCGQVGDSSAQGTRINFWASYGCDFGHGWKTIISELESIPQTTTTGKGWAFTTFAPNVTRSGNDFGSVFFDDPRSFRNTEEAPIYRWIDEAVLDERGIAEEDRCCDWGWRIFPAPCGVNGCDTYVNADVMQDQKATIYFSYFMRAPAPEGWSAVQDS